MDTRKLPRSEWKPYFDVMSRALEGQRTDIEVAGLDLGDQVEEAWLRFDGISYDPKDDVLYVYTDAVEHSIPHPNEIEVVEGSLGLDTVGVRDGEGRTQIVKLRAPLMLSTPSPRTSQAPELHP